MYENVFSHKQVFVRVGHVFIIINLLLKSSDVIKGIIL